MADRYFQCKYCKKLTLQDDTLCYITNKNIAEPKDYITNANNLSNEICNCTGAGKRLRELIEAQYNQEVALNRPINNP